MKRVVCLGSYQGGDELAWLLADVLDASGMPGDVHIVKCASPAQLPSLCTGTTALIVIDATPDLPPGCVRRVSEAELAEGPSCSSHGVDLLTALGVARALGDLPSRCVILGVGVGVGVDDSASAQLATRCLPELLVELEKV